MVDSERGKRLSKHLRGRSTIALIAAGSLVVAAALATGFRWVLVSHPIYYVVAPLAPLLLGASLCLFAAVCLLTSHRCAALGVGSVIVILIWASAPGGLTPRLACHGANADVVSIYSHNVSWESGDPSKVAAQIQQIDPDVVLLQEADPVFVDQLRETIGSTFPNVRAANSEQTLSLAMLSRWPIAAVVDTSADVDLRNPMLFATIEAPEADLRIGTVHLSAPRSSANVARRGAEFDFLLESSETSEFAQLVIGDFNATGSHADFRTFQNNGWQDLSVEYGCSIAGTWSPFGQGPGVFALDRALVGPEGLTAWQPETFIHHGYAGSDHRAIEIRLRPASQ